MIYLETELRILAFGGAHHVLEFVWKSVVISECHFPVGIALMEICLWCGKPDSEGTPVRILTCATNPKLFEKLQIGRFSLDTRFSSPLALPKLSHATTHHPVTKQDR